ncbi:MAG: MBL fold metallo-hydrolase [Deltaproteobacteria bacterium]|nr:MBL fold metallo-hydrolase [Deltaproteobacteria bacterium]
MLRATRLDEVTRFDLARSVAGRGLYWTCAYLVGDTLVDSGCAHSARELVAALRDAPLARILCTHAHEDHIGANGPLQRERPGLVVAVHPASLVVLADPRGRQHEHLYQRFMWGWPEPSVGRPLADGEVVAAGRYRFQVIYTPGHSADHVCLLEPERRWLFTGDLYVGGRDRALRADADIRDIIASLKRIAAVRPRRLFPGAARVPADAAAALEAKIAHLDDLRERILDLHRRGLGEGEIARRACGRSMPIELLTLGHYSRRWMVRSCLRAATGDGPGAPAGRHGGSPAYGASCTR